MVFHHGMLNVNVGQHRLQLALELAQGQERALEQAQALEHVCEQAPEYGLV